MESIWNFLIEVNLETKLKILALEGWDDKIEHLGQFLGWMIEVLYVPEQVYTVSYLVFL